MAIAGTPLIISPGTNGPSIPVGFTESPEVPHQIMALLEVICAQMADFDWKAGVPEMSTSPDPLDWLSEVPKKKASKIKKTNYPLVGDPTMVPQSGTLANTLETVVWDKAEVGDLIPSETGAYYCVASATHDGLKLAFRVMPHPNGTEGSLSIRVWGPKFSKHKDKLVNTVKLMGHDDYASLHVTTTDNLLAAKTVGSVLAACGVLWDQMAWEGLPK